MTFDFRPKILPFALIFRHLPKQFFQVTARSTNIVIAALVIALVGAFWWASSSRGKFDWTEHFREKKDQPYDLTIMQRLLKGYFPEKKFTEIKTKLVDGLPKYGAGKTYVLIGEAMLFDSTDTEHLLEFVRGGGTAFLSTKSIPTDLVRGLLPDECEAEMEVVPDYFPQFRSAARLNFLYNSLKINELDSFEFAYRNKPIPYSWAVIDSAMTCFDDQAQTDLGTLDDSLVNFMEWKMGRGRFLLHTCPVAFCNYFLLKKNGQQYAAGVLSHLAEGDIYYEEKNRTSESIARRRNQLDGGAPAPPGDSPLAYILKQPALAWSWYLMLGMVGAFVFFRGKRRQRIIPVLAKLENTTLDFVKTIGQLAFRQQNQSQLCQQNMKMFLTFLRERYGLAASRHEADFFRQVATVSQVPEAEVEAIFAQFHTVESNLANEKTMIAFYRGIERFYQICK